MYETPELEVAVVSLRQATSLRSGTVAKPVVDYVNGGVDEMVDDASREGEIDETEEPSLRGGGVHRSEGGSHEGGTTGSIGVSWL